MWNLERDEDYFRILDKDKNIAGYFIPDYGQIYPEEKVDEIIENMHKKHEKISGGSLLFPMVKFELFDSERSMEIDYLQKRLDEVEERVTRWQKFMGNFSSHRIQVSHTDSDMLSISFPALFKEPVPLEKKLILAELEPTLDLLREQDLL